MCRRHGRTDSVRPVAEDLQKTSLYETNSPLKTSLTIRYTVFNKIPASSDTTQLIFLIMNGSCISLPEAFPNRRLAMKLEKAPLIQSIVSPVQYLVRAAIL